MMILKVKRGTTTMRMGFDGLAVAVSFQTLSML